EGVAAGVGDPYLRILQNTLAHLLGELVNAGEDALGPEHLMKVQRRLQADHHRQVRGSEIGEAVGFQVVVMPTAEGDIDPKPLQQFVAHEQNAATLGSKQPFMRTGGIKIAAEVVQIEWNLANCMSTVHMRENAALSAKSADLFHGQDDA